MPNHSLAAPTFAPHIARVRVNASWLLKLRWAAAMGQALTVAMVDGGLGIKLPIAPLAIIIVVELLTNIGSKIWLNRTLDRDPSPENAEWGERLLTAIMLLDVLLLGGLLYFTGGSFNPFSIFYLVNLSLAAVLLRAANAWWVLAVSLGSLLVLYRWHQPMPALQAPAPELLSWFGTPDGLPLFYFGLLVSVAGAATFSTYFITRLSRELGRFEAELSRAQRRKAEADKIEALGTLAAGAAHELATPLSTIAVVVRELELDLARSNAEKTMLEDVALVREELDRCRQILDRMAGDAGERAGEELERIRVEELVDEILSGVRTRERIRLELPPPVAERELYLPIDALAQSLRSVLHNALDASPVYADVLFRWSIHGDWLVCEVQDRGSGMSADVLARAGDPFFTTKEPGKGMGLGLFLARRVVERLGGSLVLGSHPGRGTTVSIQLPLERP